MNAHRTAWEQGLERWLNFWFFPPGLALLALLRVGVGVVLLYTLFIGSFDLQAHYSIYGWGDPAALRSLDPLAWRFSILNWFANDYWLWVVHVLALLAALAFVLGILPTWSGALLIVFMLSYQHRNPAVRLELDALLLMAVFYVALLPSGHRLSVMPPAGSAAPPEHAVTRGPPQADGPLWSGFPLRVLQIHLCVLYFLSGLGRLTPDWLAGTMFWHPRMAEANLPLGFEFLQAHPQLSALVVYGGILFQLFFPVLIWMRRFRYLALGTALVVHLAVGVLWGQLAFNLLMLVLNLSFVNPLHVQALLSRLVPTPRLTFLSRP